MTKAIPLTALVTLTAVGAGTFWLTRGHATTPEKAAASPGDAAGTPAKPTATERIARGKYIVSTSACHDCHTPWKMGDKGPEPDMSRALSGHPEGLELPPPPAAQGPWIMSAAATNTAWSGPWGVSFTANLTPDEETGLGTWTEKNFIETIRNGRHLGRGRPLLPPMPAPVYANLTDEDLGSVFAYLQSLPPRKNRVPAPLPPRQDG